MKLYRNCFSKILFNFEPETVHDLSINLLNLSDKLGFLKLFENTNKAYNQNPKLRTKILGLNFRNKIGLAAGLDKNAKALSAWEKLGFGFLEVGTVTSREQSGNPKPRLFRLIKEESVLNRMGFNNKGAQEIAKKLSSYQEKLSTPLGINIGKSKIVSVKDSELVIQDYLESLSLLENYASYFSINVSSPNTPGLREIQFSFLSELLEAIRQQTSKPIFLKISPDLDFKELEKILETVENSQINGIIATNTTINRNFKNLSKELKEQEGGISGKLLAKKSLEIMKWLLKNKKKELVLISSGGIHSVEEVYKRLELGVDLIQIYTGLVFNGPGFITRINKRLLSQ